MKRVKPKRGKGTAREWDALLLALQKSVELQSHYAELLNAYDGGHRMTFKTADEWCARLADAARQLERK